MARLLTIVSSLALLAAVAPGAPVPGDKKEPAYFPTAVGAKAEYEHDSGTQTRTVTAVEDKDGAKLVTVEIDRTFADGLRDRYTTTTRVAADGVYYVGDSLFDRDGPLLLLKLPHRDGATWQVDSAVRLKWETSKSTDRYSCKAFGPEEVRVPAGTFKAIRVEQRGNMTVWYAPSVGEVKVRTVSTRTRMIRDMVLKSFKPGKQ